MPQTCRPLRHLTLSKLCSPHYIRVGRASPNLEGGDRNGGRDPRASTCDREIMSNCPGPFILFFRTYALVAQNAGFARISGQLR